MEWLQVDKKQFDGLVRDANRYQHLRSKDLETVYDGGVFAGLTPDNVVLNGDDLDIAIDEEMRIK